MKLFAIKNLVLTSVCALVLALGSQQAANAMGILYTNTQYPLLATGATAKEGLTKLKLGRGETKNILFLVEKGDASLESIVKAHDIRKIHFVDVQERSIFIFFRRITVTVYGE